MSNINKIRLSGTTYSIQDLNATKTVELTQAEYDALSVKDPNTFYIITDATAGDLSNYYTKTETDNAITAATSTKQDTLVSGTNIKTINGETLLGEGNITIQGGSGGGKAIEAGTNISITTGETADTINCTLPLTVGSGNRSLKNTTFGRGSIGEASFAMGRGSVTSIGDSSFAFGSNVTIDGYASFGAGVNVNTYNNYATVFGLLNDVSGLTEFACGQNCLSRVVDNSFNGFGNSGNTQFIVGNGKQNAGRHNAFEVRQSGDIYIVDTNDTSTSNYWEKPMIRLQDTITATAANTTALGGLKLVKLTQSEYDSLTTKDNSTLYVIVN